MQLRAATETAEGANSALRESEERFRGAFNGASIGMALVSPEGRFLEVNRALCGILGYTEDELLAKTFQDLTHPDDLEADRDLARQLLANEITDLPGRKALPLQRRTCRLGESDRLPRPRRKG